MRAFFAVVAGLSAWGSAGVWAGPAPACTTYRLDWVAGGPFNPSGRGAASPGPSQACVGDVDRASCEALHKGDGKLHPYVPIKDQGGNGNCTFQAVAGAVAFHQSLAGSAPRVSAEYLAAQDCENVKDSVTGGPVRKHDVQQALDVYGRGTCTREDLSSITNGGEVSAKLEFAYVSALDVALKDPDGKENYQQAIEDLCGLRNPSNAGQGFGELVGTWAGMTDSMAKDLKAPNATLKKQALYGARGQKNEFEYARCVSNKVFFDKICEGKVQAPAAPPLQPKRTAVTAEMKYTQVQLNQLVAACNGKLTLDPKAPITEEAIRAQLKSKAAAACLYNANQPLVEEFMKSPEAVQAKNLILGQAADRLQITGKPMVISVNNMLSLVGQSKLRQDTAHALLLTGRQAIEGRCGYWLRNSWGTACPKPAPESAKDVRCDPNSPGQVWVSADSLAGPNGANELVELGL